MRLYALTVPEPDAELVADRCWQAGAEGIWESAGGEGLVTLRVGVEEADVARFEVALADAGPTDVTATDLVELATRTVSLPAAGGPVQLEVPPTVFGDGLHPTTSTCLGLLAELAGEGTTLLDVGCGSGALSVVAARAGAVVTAIDVDPVAVEATIANAAANGVEVEASAAPLSALSGSWDVVVANISARAVIELSDDLWRVCAGTLVVSGILAERWSSVRERLGGTVLRVHDVDGWVTASLTRS
ncbi:50S ribosomal protein L11 methyltransferase [Acidimicrobiia bacterium EGI L10123]|uniref:50S ribosomal protein L11 methyltransferase n=1 Tax=Salinilacustrithrix flava TaxID=2957203 RepID=UPI003D7C1F31|nr:50S ribosomal protein L11 methyltransferase [Acidimicrobiia bacterium EGI L10123]